jgi:hypothetical protein
MLIHHEGKPMKSTYLALAALLLPALPAQAQTGMEAFNPLTFLAPIMTPLGAMLVPMQAPQGQFNPAAFNGMQMPAMPNFGGAQGMVPFNGLQATPQSFGMAPQAMTNPFAAPQTANPFAVNPFAANPFASNPFASNPFAGAPFAFPAMPAANTFPSFPNFPMMIPAR